MSRIAFPLMALVVVSACSGSEIAQPTSPASHSSASAGQHVVGSASAAAAFPRSGALHVTKECSEDTGLPGAFCTITSSNIKEIEVGARVIYLQGPDATSQDSDIILEPPGQGNNRAFGHCFVDFETLRGRCTLSGGTGKFRWVVASVDVSPLGGFDWAWDGTYSFNPRD